jgi:hypothetical protein
MRVSTVQPLVADRPLRSDVSKLFLVTFAAAALAALVSTFGVRPAASAVRERVTRTTEVNEGPLAVSVKVGGAWTPLYQAARRGDRWYLEARENAKYEVRVRNTTGRRVGFLIAVDGLNAINGLRTSLNPSEPMYVLEPYGTATVKGWRKNMNNVSRFVFVDEQRSYAERTDQGNGDLGWIRVHAFREKEEAISWRDDVRMRGQYERDGYGSGAPSVESAPKRRAVPVPGAASDAAPPSTEGLLGERKDEASPGTGWGRNERDQARWVDFEPERWAAATITLRYEYKSALVSLGILPYRDWNAGRLWERENGVYGFAQPPGR